MTLAYLDPGSGSLIASALVGGVAAAGVAAKQARYRLSAGFGRKRKQDAEVETETEADDSTETDTTAVAEADADAAPADADTAGADPEAKPTTVGSDT